jgi:triosephosphate isomerase
MHRTAATGATLAADLVASLATNPSEADVVVAPPFTALHAVAHALSGSGIALGAQNMHFEREGAFTGEVSAPMLLEAGCSHVILGHSERRHIFHEDDELVARKVRAALANGLVPIFCVGETMTERYEGRTGEVILRQLSSGLQGVAASAVAGLLVAYEPVWAIGTGNAASPAQAQEVHAMIRAEVASSHGAEAAEGLRILYGGSVKPENIASLMGEKDVDGALVGGACLELGGFLRILHWSQARPPA